MTILLALLLFGEAPNYHHIAIKDIPRFLYPRACVVGLVGRVREEADNDIHFRVSDTAGRFVVAEIIEQIPLPRPKQGQRIEACGGVRYDKAHRWYELWPLLSWQPL